MVLIIFVDHDWFIRYTKGHKGRTECRSTRCTDQNLCLMSVFTVHGEDSTSRITMDTDEVERERRGRNYRTSSKQDLLLYGYCSSFQWVGRGL